jgi:predicted dehydrogenase
MKKINFAIVGCGRIAQRHAEHIANTGILKAVCDIDLEKALKLAEKYGAIAKPVLWAISAFVSALKASR